MFDTPKQVTLSRLTDHPLSLQGSQHWRSKASRQLWRSQAMAQVSHDPADQRPGIVRLLLGETSRANQGVLLSWSQSFQSSCLYSWTCIFHRLLGQLRRFLTGCVSRAVVRAPQRSLQRICWPAAMPVAWGECWCKVLVQLISHCNITNHVYCTFYCLCSCFGGYPSAAWDFWAKTGLVTGGLYDSKMGECELN